MTVETHFARRMAAVPLMCGVAMLVPVMLMYVPPMPKPSTCRHLSFSVRASLPQISCAATSPQLHDRCHGGMHLPGRQEGRRLCRWTVPTSVTTSCVHIATRGMWRKDLGMSWLM